MNKSQSWIKTTWKRSIDWFKGKKINDVVTVKVVSTDNKGIIVKPEDCDLEFLIKKSNIAVNASDARPSRFVGGERIDAAISELNFEKRKQTLACYRRATKQRSGLKIFQSIEW